MKSIARVLKSTPLTRQRMVSEFEVTSSIGGCRARHHFSRLGSFDAPTWEASCSGIHLSNSASSERPAHGKRVQGGVVILAKKRIILGKNGEIARSRTMKPFGESWPRDEKKSGGSSARMSSFRNATA
jgi:hypothetical protein